MLDVSLANFVTKRPELETGSGLYRCFSAHSKQLYVYMFNHPVMLYLALTQSTSDLLSHDTPAMGCC
jgi:hypothetical protein